MSIYLVYLIIAAVLVVVELLYFRIADRLNIIDKPNQRSSHTRIVLRGGGVIFLIGAWIYQAFFGWEYTLFMIGLTAIGLISFADDIHSVPNKYRLIVQFASMMLMFGDLGLYTSEYWWVIIPALIVCVGIINAYNFMDGINGITGCYSLAVLLPLLYLDLTHEFIDVNFLYVSLLSVLVFLFFNFRKKAKCFAGDVGSVSIAFIVLFSLGRLIMQTGNLAYLLFLAVYGADSILTIVHRIMLHENLGEAHRKHAYQLMSNELKLPHTLVSAIYMALQLIVSFGLIFLVKDGAPCGVEWFYFAGVVVILALAYIVFMKKYYPLHDAYLKTLSK